MVDYIETKDSKVEAALPTKIWQQYPKLTIALNFINKETPLAKLVV
jgi:hypothetical protein